jgi:F0F1-type ATP synthase assembly protein I
MPGQTNVTWLRYVALGLELAVTVGGGAFAGWWLDRTLASAPWGLLFGSLLGMAVGLANLIRRAMRATHPDEADRERD